MSAPALSQRKLTPLRLVGAGAFTLFAFLFVWQCFGLAGFGTSAHPLRIFVALVPLVAAGIVLVRRNTWFLVRAASAPVGLAGAFAAWWFVPCWIGGLSLSEALARRAELRQEIISPKLEEMDRGFFLRKQVAELRGQYGELMDPRNRDMLEWTDGMVRLVDERFEQIPTDDLAAARDLKERTAVLGREFPEIILSLDASARAWEAKAITRCRDELSKLPPGDWPGFNATAVNRRTLAEALPDTRAALQEAESEWVESSAAGLQMAGAGVPLEDWKRANWSVLALKSLDTAENRFANARRVLFTGAHQRAKAEAFAHFEAGRYDRAFGIARAHAVDWSATAEILGEAELNALADLRATCAFFEALAAKSPKPPEPLEPAPPPRPKP